MEIIHRPTSELIQQTRNAMRDAGWTLASSAIPGVYVRENEAVSVDWRHVSEELRRVLEEILEGEVPR